MRRSAFVATLLGVMLFATSPQAAKRLPEQTALSDFVTFLQKTVVGANATEEDGRYLSTIGDIASIRFVEDTHDGLEIDEIVQFVLRSTSRHCTAFRPTAVTREELDGMTLVRVAVRCAMTGAELHGEELIIADATRYHNYSIGGSMQNRDKISAIATSIFKVLVATYR
jgi:hypothetical protein